MSILRPEDENITLTTTILLSNIHCPSCVRTIKDTLNQFGDSIHNVSTSTVSQTVTIKHTQAVSSSILAKSLYEAGFDVQSTWEQRGNNRISTFASSILDSRTNRQRTSHAFLEFSCGMLQTPDQHRDHAAMHSAYCEQCAVEDGNAQREDSDATLITPSRQVAVYDDKHSIQDLTNAAEPTTRYKAVLSIYGMTCSACVGRVAEVLEAKPYVTAVSINLIGQSATIEICDRDKAGELVEEVEDIGYDASLESCTAIIDNLNQDMQVLSDRSTKRTITLQVTGIHCQHCPGKIIQAVEQEHPEVEIVSTVDLTGLITITYSPAPPEFTIRHILRSIEEADPEFKASVFQPPSLEEKAKQVQIRHRQGLIVRLCISIAMAVPTLILGVIVMSLLPEDDYFREYWMHSSIGQTPRVQWPLLAFASIVYFFAADVFHRRAVKEVYMMWRPASKVSISRRLYRFGSMDMLLCLGTTIAYVGSIVILIISSNQQSQSMGADSLDTTTYFDAVVFLTMFLLMGRLLEAYGKSQTADAVTSLGKLRASKALLVNDQALQGGISPVSTIPVSQLEVGDIVAVTAGASPPCDGIIHYGTTTVNESSLTGESKPISKTVGDEIFAGTVNITNVVHMRVTGISGASLLDRIIDTVREGQAKRAPIERIADIITGYFVPMIILIALVDWIIWLVLGVTGHVPYVEVKTGGWTFWSLQFSIAVLVVACPCGIGLAAPTALYVGTGLAAKQGILVKGGGEAFQDASALDCVVFDKTGTITQGDSLQVTNSSMRSSMEQASLLNILHSLESASSHPLAKAMTDFCASEVDTKSVNFDTIDELPGKGMIGKCSDAGHTFEIFIGNISLAEEKNLFLNAEDLDEVRAWSSEGKTVMLVGSKADDEACFKLDMILATSDSIRPEAFEVVNALQSKGMQVWLLSGDNITTTRVVAAQVGIPADHVIAGVLPHEKADKIRYLQQVGRPKERSWFSRHSHKDISAQRASVAMVGDGINDAPALATADVGIAMGCGSDTAISTASFVLLSSDLSSVLTLVKLSKTVLRRVKFNFFWALAYNCCMLPIAAGVLFPVVSNGSHIRLDPVWASLAMALSSVSVVVSSLLLRSRLPGIGFRA